MDKLKIFEELVKFKSMQEEQMRSDEIYRQLYTAFTKKMAEKHKVLALIATDGTCFHEKSISSIMNEFLASGKQLSPSSVCLDFPKVFASVRKTGTSTRPKKRAKIESS